MLRVGDEHAGKNARCPLCSTIYVVGGQPNAASPTAESPFTLPNSEPAASKADSTGSWFMKTENGQEYGPVSRADLDDWFRDGRVTTRCQFRADNGEWQSAASVFPALNVGPSAASSGNPYATPAGGSHSGSVNTGRPMSSYATPHRGGLILAFGLLSWIVCPVFGFVAFLLGSADLKEMDAGRMDPSGHGLTQAGYIVGLIHAILVGIVVLGFGCIIGMGAIGAAAG